ALLRGRLLAAAVVVESGDRGGGLASHHLIRSALNPVLLVVALLQLAGDSDLLPLLKVGSDVLSEPLPGGDGQESRVAVLPLAGLLVLATRVARYAEARHGGAVARVAQLRVCDEGCFGDGDLRKCHECSFSDLRHEKSPRGYFPTGRVFGRLWPSWFVLGGVLC